MQQDVRARRIGRIAAYFDLPDNLVSKPRMCTAARPAAILVSQALEIVLPAVARYAIEAFGRSEALDE